MSQVKLVRFDWAMKNILRDKSNFDILEGFLSELLKEQIKIDHLLESEFNKTNEDNKFNRVDILAHTQTNEKIIVEVQAASAWDFFHRILFGVSKVITEYIKEGAAYSKVPKVISVSILYFTLGEAKDYIYYGGTNFTGLHLHDSLNLSSHNIQLYLNKLNKHYESASDIFPEYYLIQLPKFTGKLQDKFDQWVYLLKNETIESDFNAQGIISAKNKLDVLKLSDIERKAYNKYWENVSFEASLAETHEVELDYVKRKGKTEGIAEGMEKGRQEGKTEVVRGMLKSGINLLLIKEASQLTDEEIESIKSTLELSNVIVPSKERDQ